MDDRLRQLALQQKLKDLELRLQAFETKRVVSAERLQKYLKDVDGRLRDILQAMRDYENGK